MLPFSYQTFIFSKHRLPPKYTDSVTITPLPFLIPPTKLIFQFSNSNVWNTQGHSSPFFLKTRNHVVYSFLQRHRLTWSSWINHPRCSFLQLTHCPFPHFPFPFQIPTSSHLQGRDSLLNLPLCWLPTLSTLQLLHISCYNIIFVYLYVSHTRQWSPRQESDRLLCYLQYLNRVLAQSRHSVIFIWNGTILKLLWVETYLI